MNKSPEIIRKFKVETDEVLFKNLDFDSRLKEKVLKRLKFDEVENVPLRIDSKIWKKRTYWIIAASLLVALIVIGTMDSRNSMLSGTSHKSGNNNFSKNEQARIDSTTKGKVDSNNDLIPGRAKPAPLPYSFPIEIATESYPVHPNQILTIKPKGQEWNGDKVKLYYVPETELSEDQLLYKKALPEDAQYIGETSIADGKWSFEWQAPSLQKDGRYGSFLIAALADDGTLSCTRLETLVYDKLELSPSTVKIGQKVELSGTGFPNGDVRIDILKNSDDKGTVLQATIGMLHSTKDSFSFSFELSPEINGYVIKSGLYQIQAVIIPKDQPREGVFVNLNVVQ
ncbi:MAG: hypothetical protein Q8920_13290 [Bacillota bacterium]|nr:hypothetical protein [Bacillota bacterium]